MNYIYANIDADIIDSGEMKFNKVSAEVDEFSGTPGVTVTLIGEDRNDLHFFFHNLKGDQGVQGPVGNGIASVTVNSNYGLVFTLDNGTQLSPTSSVRGPEGAGLGPGGTLPWSNVVDTPASYTPSAHTHTISEVDGLRGELNTINSTLETKANSSQLNYKQDKLYVGSNIIIDEKNVISATTDSAVTSKLNDIDTSINSITVNLASLSSTVSTNQENNNNRFVTNETNISSNSTKITKLTNDVNDINSSLVTVSGVVDGLVENKVDKSLVTGSTVRYQVLSDNNYTDDEKTKLFGIQTSAQVNKIESIELNGSTLPISDKVVNLGNLVEQVEGKGLSSNDFTDGLKNKLTGIESGAQVNLDPEIIVNDITYTPTISGQTWSINLGTIATSDVVENIDGRVTILEGNWPGTETELKTWVTNGLTPIASIETALNNKVNVIEGKSLSTNDFTNGDADKLDNIESGAQVNTIESIKLNGTTVTVENKEADLGYLVSGVKINNTDYIPETSSPIDLGNYIRSSSSSATVVSTITDEPILGDEINIASVEALRDYLKPMKEDIEKIKVILGGI